MTIKGVELLISMVSVLFTYFICSSLIGYTRALVAEKMGDNTPESFGFLTLNPFAHVSRIWIVLIVWLQVIHLYMPFGLGRYIPINPVVIQGRYRGFKLAAVYFSDSFAAIIIAIIAFFGLIALHGAQALFLLNRAMTLHNVELVTPHISTLGMIATWFLMTFFLMATLMSAFGLIINCFHFMYFYFFENALQDNEYADMIMLFGPLLLLYVLIYVVQDSIINFVTLIAYILAYCIGIIG